MGLEKESLPDDSELFLPRTEEPCLCKCKARGAVTISVRFVILYVLVTVSIALLALCEHLQSQHRTSKPYSPANEALKYSRRKFWDHEKTVYQKEPGPEVDAAWNDLLAGVNIRMTYDEMKVAGEETVAAAQLVNGDYVAVLGVYHQLHCLNVLRTLIHKDYYFPSLSKQDWDNEMAHWSHCIESLRRSTICHADVAVYGTEWIASSHIDPNKRLRSNAEAVCVDWGRVKAWAEARALERDQYLLLPGPFEHKAMSNVSEFD